MSTQNICEVGWKLKNDLPPISCCGSEGWVRLLFCTKVASFLPGHWVFWFDLRFSLAVGSCHSSSLPSILCISHDSVLSSQSPSCPWNNPFAFWTCYLDLRAVLHFFPSFLAQAWNSFQSLTFASRNFPCHIIIVY